MLSITSLRTAMRSSAIGVRSAARPSAITAALRPTTAASYGASVPAAPVASVARPFSTTPVARKTNTSTRTKENVHDLETFLTLIGRNSIEHLELFESDLDKFLGTSSKQMKQLGIDIQSRKYLLRWIHKFQNDLEPLREHKRGKKKNGGERNAREVLAKRTALERLEERERFEKNELEAENKGERVF